MVITPKPGYGVEMVLDDTARQDNGVSVSALFGMSHIARASRAGEFAVRSDVASNPDRLSLARPDLSVALNTRVLEAGDTRGAIALNAVRDMPQPIPSAGLMSAQNASLSTYAARFGGEIGRRALQAEREANASTAVATAAIDRRSSVEGVSIDDELVMLTTYQQSYAASARVIQAATEMIEILMRLGA
jgi:flagellar hook-associated protein 1 FlgK